jgi:uncharacterized membrane protein
MLALVKAIHFLALVFGSAASLGNIYLALAAGPHDLPAPGFTNALRKLYRFTALFAILVLWATGLVLMLGEYGWWVPSRAFDIKIAFAILLTAIIFWLNLRATTWARTGGPPSYVKYLHWTGTFGLLMVVTLAVFAFN